MKYTYLTTEQLKQIRDRLPRNSGKEIAKRTKLSYNTVSKTLTGSPGYFNRQVIEMAYTIIEEENKKYAVLEARHSAIFK